MTPTIRTVLRPGDMSWILSSHMAHYPPNYGYGIEFEYYCIRAMQETYELYRPDRSRCWMVEEKGRREGSLILLDRGDLAQLRFFYLSEGLRGRGLGKQLMQSFMDRLAEKNYAGAFLWTTDEQEAALNIYQSFGFRLTEERTSETFGRVINEQRWELRR